MVQIYIKININLNFRPHWWKLKIVENSKTVNKVVFGGLNFSLCFTF
jgi:hypothetical protein